jgi:hypothetical protein
MTPVRLAMLLEPGFSEDFFERSHVRGRFNEK